MSETAATDSIIIFDATKNGLQQRAGGDWVLRLVVPAIGMDERIVQAAMGTRYRCKIVEIDGDEASVDHKRDKWKDLGEVKQAAIRCKDPVFWAFLAEELDVPIPSEEEAALAVRFICSITSRSDLGKPGFSYARTQWRGLDRDFQGWKIKEGTR